MGLAGSEVGVVRDEAGSGGRPGMVIGAGLVNHVGELGSQAKGTVEVGLFPARAGERGLRYIRVVPAGRPGDRERHVRGPPGVAVGRGLDRRGIGLHPLPGLGPWRPGGPACSLYKLSADGRVTELFGGVGLSNGLDWSPDRTRFYYADSRSGGVDVFICDPLTGELGTRTRFVSVQGGIPDGLTLDADGCLWLAVFGTGEVRRYTPDGELDTVISLPVGQDNRMTEMIPAEPGCDYATLFAVERDRLRELLAGLRAEDWQRPSPCPGWSILGLCCHLLGDDFGLLARHRDGHHGTVPPAGATEGEFITWLDELQAEWVRAARRLSPRLLTELLSWTGPQVADTFRREDARARTASVSWASPGLVPAWLDQARELSEYWIHRQQLLQGLGRPGDLRADVAGPVLDGLRWAYPYRLSQAHADPGDTVTITVTGPVARTWHLVATDAGWQFANEPGARLGVTLTLSTDQAWRLLTNNLPAGSRGDLTHSGDAAVTGILLNTRAIIGAPKWA